jgi:RNA polymerase sigma factor (sigma-70 family)
MNEPMMTPEEEVAVIEAWQQRKEPKALERLVMSHARLAYAMASRYTNNQDHMEDLAAEGIIGIMKAADKYDPTQGTRFCTYCRWWIMTFISASAAKVATVVDMPSRTYIDAKMGRLGEDGDKAHMAVFGGIDLDAPINDEADLSAIDLLECPRPNPEQATTKKFNEVLYAEFLVKTMATLKPREREILQRRRLSDFPETLEEIAESMGITRERVRQIEAKAFGKLRRALISAGFPVSSLR